MFWIKGVLVVIGLLAVAGVGLVFYGASLWAQNTRALLLRLESTRVPPAPARYSVQELEGLPARVQRYFRAALKDGQRIVAAVSVEHTGSFNLGSTGEQWKSFASAQRVVTRRPGFVWDGRWSNYQVRDGRRVPLTGEVAWLTAEGRKPYWRGTITTLRYKYAD